MLIVGLTSGVFREKPEAFRENCEKIGLKFVYLVILYLQSRDEN